MSAVTELKKDAEELRQLIEKAERKRIKDILGVELRKLETDILTKEQQNNAEQQTPTLQGETTKRVAVTSKPKKDIKTYAWDQSDKFMKIYATVDGVEKVPKENITCDFEVRSFKLLCKDVGSKDFFLTVLNLFEDIVPAESYFKVKTNTVLLMLKKKAASKTWAYVTQRDKKEKEAKKPNFDETKDPQESLMGLMKQMYDEGDDDMKRQLNKAWSESRAKQGAGDMML